VVVQAVVEVVVPQVHRVAVHLHGLVVLVVFTVAAVVVVRELLMLRAASVLVAQFE
jgi:amino acid permease